MTDLRYRRGVRARRFGETLNTRPAHGCVQLAAAVRAQGGLWLVGDWYLMPNGSLMTDLSEAPAWCVPDAGATTNTTPLVFDAQPLFF